jgi:hypothetical protein
MRRNLRSLDRVLRKLTLKDCLTIAQLAKVVIDVLRALIGHG